MKESKWIFNFWNYPKCASCGTVARSEYATPYCAFCGSYMKNYREQPCKCWHKDNICWGTKEREECTCGGDQRKCNFYEEVRRRANGEAF